MFRRWVGWGVVWLLGVLLLPPGTTVAAPHRVDSGWIARTSDHFEIHVLPGTTAHRDLDAIVLLAEARLARMATRLEMAYEGRLDLYLIERLFWQGAAVYNGNELLISYLDRNYVDVPLETYLDHELAHALAHTWLPEEGRSSGLLAEGLAVWATGGHYGPEPIHAMAAALPSMGAEIPLARLREDFYAEQHEIAYIEAASFVGWLINREGLDAFKRLYGAADQPEALLGVGYDQLEVEWRGWLATSHGAEVALGRDWWEAQIRLFETMRRYGERLDPLARVLPETPSEWPEPVRRQYHDNEDGVANIALESQLIAASEALSCDGEAHEAHRLLDEVERALSGEPAASGPLADRLAIAGRLVAQATAIGAQRPVGLLHGAAPTSWLSLLRELARFDGEGPQRQEVARLRIAERRATVWLLWYGTEGARALRYTYQRGGDGWRLTEVAPLPIDRLNPRSSRLCTN